MSPEQDAFLSTLYHENFKHLLGYAYHYTFSWAKAEVVVQEAFCVAVEKIDAVMASRSPIGWMKLAIKNVARNMARHDQYQQALFLYLDDLNVCPTAPDGLGETDILEVCEQIAGKEAFRLFKQVALEGTPYSDAAKERGIKEWACRKRVQRTSQVLRDGLKKYFE